MKTECPTRLLSDLPASKDAFGAHARVADAIATLLMEEEGGKEVASLRLFGSCGLPSLDRTAVIVA